MARYPEHIPPKNPRAPIIIENVKSNFAKHIISKKHTCSSCIWNKGNIMNALNEFEIYKAFENQDSKDNILNDQLHFKSHALYI